MMRRRVRILGLAPALTATVAVLASACGGQAHIGASDGSRGDDRGAAAAAAAVTHYRVIRGPIALIEPTSSGPAFQVRVRMSARLPTDDQGVNANVLVGTSGSDAPPVPFGRRSRHCYAAVIGNDVHGGDPKLKDAHQGTVVPVSIRVRGQATITKPVVLNSQRADISALGCGKR
jgi:hypothetical protein